MVDNDPYAGLICFESGVDNCPPCGKIDITIDEYSYQMDRADSEWFCPRCKGRAEFDDDRYEELQEIEEYQE